MTISEAQKELAEQNCKGLPVEIRLQDYRDLNQKFDRIASIGMFEHVGFKNYQTYMNVAHRCLVNRGIFLLHTIGSNDAYYSPDPWINKYIFPNGMLPAISQIGKSIEGLFVMEDWHNFGPYDDKTLLAWTHNFNAHWDEFKNEYPEYFIVCGIITYFLVPTNAVESLHRQFRKVTKNKAIFPTDEALLKMLFLAARDISKKWTLPIHSWKTVISYLSIAYGERLGL